MEVVELADKCFKFYESYRDACRQLTGDQWKRLTLALCGAVFDGDEPDLSDDPVVRMAFTTMRGQAAASWEQVRTGRENGRRGGRGRKKDPLSEEKESLSKDKLSSSKRAVDAPPAAGAAASRPRRMPSNLLAD